jgi:hypothetical protein
MGDIILGFLEGRLEDLSLLQLPSQQRKILCGLIYERSVLLSIFRTCLPFCCMRLKLAEQFVQVLVGLFLALFKIDTLAFQFSVELIDLGLVA